jgi:hypothetical protein
MAGNELISCEVCEAITNDNLLWCADCKAYFCKQPKKCWSEGAAKHKSTSLKPHTSTALALKRHVERIFDVYIPEEKHNVDTTHWFGVKERNDDEKKTFFLHSTGRLTALLGRLDKPDEHFPSLVSFVGRSGSGKSTLIRALMVLRSQRNTHSPPILPIPGGFMHLGKSTTEAVRYQISPLCKILLSNCCNRYIYTKIPHRSMINIQFSLQTAKDLPVAPGTQP